MNHYLEHALDSKGRLFSLLDTTPSSPAYGSFSRKYWHFKTSDYPNGANQQAVLSLAKLYSLDFENNKLYKSQQVLELIIGALDFTAAIQKKDGSFDEWYVNERGWAGPTAYIVHALCDSLYLIREDLPIEKLKKLEHVIYKGGEHLLNSNERHHLANHVAIAMLALTGTYRVSKDEKFLRGYKDLLKTLKTLFDDHEGWSLEYDGADPGYQSATVSFLSRIYEYNRCEILKEICMKSLEFISHFAYPDGSFGGCIGMRHTTNIFYYGIEYWKEESDVSRSLSLWIRKNFHKQTLPRDHDDEYFIYRFHELLDAALIRGSKSIKEKDTPFLPMEQLTYQNTFKNAGIIIKSNPHYYFVANLKRGGAYKVFSKKSSRSIENDCGVILKEKDQLYSSLWKSESFEMKSLTCYSRLSSVTPQLFTPIKMIVFRLFLLIFGFHAKSAMFIKDAIRKILIVKDKKSPIKYQRSFELGEDQISIETKVENLHDKESTLYYGGEFYTRHVPQSRYFGEDDLFLFTSKQLRISESSFLDTKIIHIKD